MARRAQSGAAGEQASKQAGNEAGQQAPGLTWKAGSARAAAYASSSSCSATMSVSGTYLPPNLPYRPLQGRSRRAGAAAGEWQRSGGSERRQAGGQAMGSRLPGRQLRCTEQQAAQHTALQGAAELEQWQSAAGQRAPAAARRASACTRSVGLQPGCASGNPAPAPTNRRAGRLGGGAGGEHPAVARPWCPWWPSANSQCHKPVHQLQGTEAAAQAGPAAPERSRLVWPLQLGRGLGGRRGGLHARHAAAGALLLPRGRLPHGAAGAVLGRAAASHRLSAGDGRGALHG